MLELSVRERLARARSDFASGAPVAISTDQGDALAVAAEALSEARRAALSALGPVDLAVTARRAQTLRARAYDGDLARLIADEMDLARLRAAADPALALEAPLSGPFTARRDGAAAPHRRAIALARAARLLPAALVAPVADAAALAQAHGLTLLRDGGDPADSTGALAEAVSAALPVEAARDARLRLFRLGEGGEEHAALEIGAPDRAGAALIRLHSACFTGDVLGSLKCDCGPQLRAALARIGAEGAGILLYLNQEGRGIGLANKLRAYGLQAQGFDTVEANHRLGFEDDERDFAVAAAMLRALGFGRVRLLTNNPRKVAGLEAAGIAVAGRVPLIVGRNRLNAGYLDVKAAKSGHLL